MQALTDTRVDPQRFAEQAAALSTELRASPPAPGDILFYGSSTMANWRAEGLLERQFTPLAVRSTGFGGSTAEEALYYYRELVLPARPAVLVYYEGDNDLGLGYSGAEVLELSHRLFEWARRDLPGIRFVIIPVKDYPAQTASKEALADLNAAFADYAAHYDDTAAVDIGPVLFDAAGVLRADIWQADGVHFNEQGYELLAAQVQSLLDGLLRQS